VCPIIATPFTPSGEIDYGSLRNEVRVLAEGGCHAAALFGIVSEFFKLADEERDRMVEVVTEEADAHDLPLVLSVTHESTEIAVERAKAYDEAGADCVMVLPPSTLGPPRSEIVEHLTRIGEAVSVPVMVQDLSIIHIWRGRRPLTGWYRWGPDASNINDNHHN
jgi:4-hydroxy-tetrahydrodipicolinate synthase